MKLVSRITIYRNKVEAVAAAAEERLTRVKRTEQFKVRLAILLSLYSFLPHSLSFIYNSAIQSWSVISSAIAFVMWHLVSQC